MKTTTIKGGYPKTMSQSTIGRGGSTSAGKMKLRVGVHLSEMHHIVEDGKRITTAELLRSINQAADRFLRERCWHSRLVTSSKF